MLTLMKLIMILPSVTKDIASSNHFGVSGSMKLHRSHTKANARVAMAASTPHGSAPNGEQLHLSSFTPPQSKRRILLLKPAKTIAGMNING